jgi:lipopolysaccharide transport system ATP-binding protein
MENNDVLIAVKNLSKEYILNGQKFMALDNVSFTLNKNQGIGLIGKNGSGKSTLLKILAGIIKPSQGEVRIYGKINSLIEIGSNFIPDLTGRENVNHFLKLNNIPNEEIPDIIERIYNYSELEEFFDQPVKFYSSGMFVRLAISSGFEVSADIFLMDEVLMAGDSSFREKVSETFKTLLRKGCSVIIASHNPSEIMNYTSECFWLDHGLLKERKSSNEVLKDYYMQYANELSDKNKKANELIVDVNKDKPSSGQKIDEGSPSLTIENHKDLSYNSGIDFKISYPFKEEFREAFPVVKVYSVLLKPLLSLIPTLEIRNELELAPQNATLNLTCSCPPKILRNGKYFAELSFVEQPIAEKDFVKEVAIPKLRTMFELKSEKNAEVGNDSFEIYILPQGNWALK